MPLKTVPPFHGFDFLQGGGLRDQAGLAEGGHGGGELGEDRDALRRGGGGDRLEGELMY